MKETRLIMGMPITIELIGENAPEAFEAAFAYLVAVDERFSTYKETSEISKINRGELDIENASGEMKEVFTIAEKTRLESEGYFNIKRPDGKLDPSGIVKGWAILNTEKLVRGTGFESYFINAGGDIASGGEDSHGREWSIGIKNPLNTAEIVKVIYPHGKGVATSGSYERGAHIYNPHMPEKELKEILSITVIGPNVLEADRFATAAFAMGKRGIGFIEERPGLEGYAIDAAGIATITSGFPTYAPRAL